jgi:hypothetical protein
MADEMHVPLRKLNPTKIRTILDRNLEAFQRAMELEDFKEAELVAIELMRCAGTLHFLSILKTE